VLPVVDFYVSTDKFQVHGELFKAQYIRLTESNYQKQEKDWVDDQTTDI